MPSTAALFISAAASGQGKTTVTAAIARLARGRGMRVRVFKTGPDFIDPMILECASGHPVYQLDLWMGGERHVRELLGQAAAHADLILIEGVMGLFDGEPSSADLAQRYGVPIVTVIDAGAMAQTFGAVAHGLASYRPALTFHGVLANRVGGAEHAQMLAKSLPPGLRWLGALSHDAALAIPDRHLGLLQAREVADLDARLERAAAAVAEQIDLEHLPPAAFPDATAPEPHRQLLEGVRIAIAHDAACSFLYQANLDLLRAMGAKLFFFSPIADSAFPQADAVYLPGGYPELHAERLAMNHALHRALRVHVEAGRPLLAECGGMMLLFEHLTDVQGRRHALSALLPGETTMQPTLQALALQGVTFEDGELRGHSFHYSRLATPLAPQWRGRTQYGADGEPVFRHGSITASYIHFYWPSNPRALARLLTRA